MGISQSYGSDEAGTESISDINVTPLVDVTLVLLIIMMVAAPLVSRSSGIHLDLPKMRNAAAVNQASLVVHLKRHEDGRPGYDLYLGGDVQGVDGPNRLQKLKEFVIQKKEKDPQVQAQLNADAGVAYGDVMAVLDVIKDQGVQKFTMTTERIPGLPEGND